MNKSILAAAAFAALALGTAGSANAGVAGGNLGGVRAAVPELAQQVHWRPYKHHHKRWHKHRKKKVCTYRWGKRRCWWR